MCQIKTMTDAIFASMMDEINEGVSALSPRPLPRPTYDFSTSIKGSCSESAAKHRAMLFASRLRTLNEESNAPPITFIGGNEWGDTKFRERSNKCEIGVTANDINVGYCMLFLARIVEDGPITLLDYVIRSAYYADEIPGDMHQICEEEIIACIVKSERERGLHTNRRNPANFV